ncbi:MAG: hypothetical protein AABX38_05570 [Candidatus Micrarchaeota archaeon]
MKEENRYFFVPVILFFILLLLVFYNFFLYKPVVEQKYVSINSGKNICVESDQKACIVNNSCKGISVCRSNFWSECIINRTCETGSRIPCYSENSCSTGYRVCDQCGNYGSCIYSTTK